MRAASSIRTRRSTTSTTNDIVGGNSGSPLVDAQGRLVGLAFDGNIHSIAGSYWYDEKMNRAVAVHPAIIITALREVYGANAIAAEIWRRVTRSVTRQPARIALERRSYFRPR